VRTTASGYVLTGTKDRVEHGAQADVLLVSARDDSGVSLFLIPADRAGVTVTPMTALDMCRRYAQVRFESVALTEADLVGVFGAAAAILEYQALISGLMQTAETVGVLTSVFDMTVAWAFDRYTFGRPLASYQALKHRFADMRTWIEASAAIASTAAHAVQDGEAAAALTVCAAQSFVGDIAPRIIQDCVQLHGGIGMTWEHDLHLYLRRAVVNRALHGTPEEHRRIIADLIEL
jgi:alkylation response protein AidB-like acyl-CoA dehydrogenase